MQRIVTQLLEHGLLLYEKRHPGAKGLIQGSVVVLKNRDASILAERRPATLPGPFRRLQ